MFYVMYTVPSLHREIPYVLNIISGFGLIVVKRLLVLRMRVLEKLDNHVGWYLSR